MYIPIILLLIINIIIIITIIIIIIINLIGGTDKKGIFMTRFDVTLLLSYLIS